MLANHRLSSLAFAGALLGTSVLCDVASAGPLVDWLLNNRYGNTTNVTANYPIAVAPIAYAAGPYSPTQNAMVLPTYPTVPYSSSYAPISQQTLGYVPTTTQALGYAPTTQQTLGYLPIPQTTLGVLPIGSYQTTLNRVPTTYYRPVTSLDPNTGTTVTTLQPCTSYQQQVLRTPVLGTSGTPYYAAYGGYGTSLQQSGYGPSYGSTIATAPGQSTLAIPSTVNGLSSVNRIPVTGTVVNPAPIITSSAGYTPVIVQSAPAVSYGTPVTTYPAATLPPVVQSGPTNYSSVPASSYPTGTTYLNNTLPTYPTGTTDPSITYPNANYSTAPIQTQTSQYTPPATSYPGATGNSIVQADGTIITPLGSSTSLASPQNTYSNPPSYSGSNYAPQTYSNQNYGAVGTSVLPNDTTAPQNNSYPVQSGSGNPALNGNYLPQGSGSNPAISSDPASLTPPSLSPLSSNSLSPNNKTVVSTDYSKMVAIDRPSQNAFTRNPVTNNPTTSNAFVNDKAVAPAAAYSDSTAAPALLKPRASENELQGVRPPEGYSPKPYWRSKQQSAAPNALYNDQEKTARNELNVVNTNRVAAVSDLNSGAQVQFVAGQRQNGGTSDSKVETAVVTQPNTAGVNNGTFELKRNPVTGRKLPASR